MNARIKPRIDLLDRVRLKDEIPLRTPYVIYVDPCDRCNFQCKFCPTGNREILRKVLSRGHGVMDFELYKKLVDGFCEFDDVVKVVRLYKDGEPLLNPRFPDMVAYAKKSGCCEKVDTTSNASLLTRELGSRIVEAGLDRVNISVEGVNGAQYKEFSNISLDYEKFVDNIAYFYERRAQCEVFVKINGDILDEEQTRDFYKTFGAISDGIFVERAIDYWPRFEQTKVAINEEVGLLGDKSREVLVCPYVFYEMAVNSDGTYSLCRFDWKRMQPLGGDLGANVTPKRIWNSIHLWRLQCLFLRGERKSRWYCANCGELRQGSPVDLDEFREMLLDQF
jgi:MoaA/NifB/PqqE/SkfB family radical SAM enzyme